jgi:hypothetical protein
MGFLKFVGCVVGGMAAVVAAPVVLPMAAAVGGAVAGGVAAAGGAVAAGAAAVGSAAAGTAIGSAAISAGTAVAGVATTGMAAVGGAAGLVGLGSVAGLTGTTAGAAAVGTITTSVAVGAQQSLSAKEKIERAESILDEAKARYKSNEDAFNKKQNKVNINLKSLADVKARVAKKLLEMNAYVEKIKNPSRLKDIKVSADERVVKTEMNFNGYPIPAQDWAKGLTASYASGNILGVALTGCITSTITTAGTGAAISSLSGAAATNATMAALGGGTLASGGMGMAGGAIMAKGLVFAPAFAIGGFMLNSKAKDALDQAHKIDRNVDEAVANFDQIGEYYVVLTQCILAMRKNILTAENKYNTLANRFYALVDRQADADYWNDADWNLAFAALNLAKVLEAQCIATLEKPSDKEYDVKSIISLNDIDDLNYKKDFIKFNGVGTTELINRVM